MNSNVIKLLLGMCLLLLVVLLIEWWLAGAYDDQLEGMLAMTEERQGDNLALPELSLTKQSLESYSDMVERPLFIEGRKPIVDVEEESDNTEQVGQIDDMVLVGIYAIEGRITAMFSTHQADKKYLKKSEGDDLTGWMITEIQSDKVILERAGQKQTIKLRKPKPQTKPKLIPRTNRKPKPGSRQTIKLKS